MQILRHFGRRRRFVEKVIHFLGQVQAHTCGLLFPYSYLCSNVRLIGLAIGRASQIEELQSKHVTLGILEKAMIHYIHLLAWLKEELLVSQSLNLAVLLSDDL